VYKVFFLRATL